MQVIHLSDLHDNYKILKRILERYPDHYIVITGDITNHGSEEEYARALAALWPFRDRIFLCPGNHDFGPFGNIFLEQCAKLFDTMLAIPLKQRGFFFGDNLPVVNIVNNVEFIALDTNLETMSPFDFACGEVGTRQLEALDKILQRSIRKTILFFHHRPSNRHDPFMELKDSRELARVIYGRVDVLLFGHRHIQEHLKNVLNIPHILASGKSPDESTAAEITIEGDNISVQYINV